MWRYTGSQFSQAQTLRRHQNEVNSVSFSSDGSYFASGSADKTVRVWRVGRIGDKSPQEQPRQPGLAKALDFEVKAFNGELLSLKKYRGKVVLLDFWAMWCGPCLVEMPNVKRVYKKHKDQNFQIIGISLDTNRSSLRSYLRRERIPWPQFFDGAGWDNSVAQRYGINGIPQTYLIDGNGFIRKENLRGRALEVAVAELVTENNHRKNFRKVRRKR